MILAAAVALAVVALGLAALGLGLVRRWLRTHPDPAWRPTGFSYRPPAPRERAE